MAIAAFYPAALATAHFQHPILAFLAVPAIAAAARGVGRFGLKLMLKGDGYGREEMARDGLITAIEVATFFMSRFLPMAVLRRPIDMGAKMGLKTVVKLGEVNDINRTPAHALKLRDLPRILDEDGTHGFLVEPDLLLSDHAICANGACALTALDLPFEMALRDMLSAKA